MSRQLGVSLYLLHSQWFSIVEESPELAGCLQLRNQGVGEHKRNETIARASGSVQYLRLGRGMKLAMLPLAETLIMRLRVCLERADGGRSSELDSHSRQYLREANSYKQAVFSACIFMLRTGVEGGAPNVLRTYVSWSNEPELSGVLNVKEGF